MAELRPVGYILGLLLISFGVLMLLPMLLDQVRGDANGLAFLEAAIQTVLFGLLLSTSCRNSLHDTLTIRQAFVLTAGIWTVLPLFCALPFIEGAPKAAFTDAYFETVSGLTTTGSSVFNGLQDMPRGVILWRGMLNWLGGLGIAFVAMIFLPVMRVGGMQFFRTEGFDTMGKILPRAGDIARMLVVFYTGLTGAAFLSYVLTGMPWLHALVHAFATISTGGFSTSDDGFGAFSGAAEYVGSVFIILASLPYIRFVQAMSGHGLKPLYKDEQVRAYLRWIATAVGLVVLYRLFTSSEPVETIFRQSLFNLISIFSGTGFGSADVSKWGEFPVMIAFMVGMIGGCTSSSAAAISVFRWQLTLKAIRAQITRLHLPHIQQTIRYEGRTVGNDILDPLILYVTGYILTMGVMIMLLDMTGTDAESAIFAVWTSLGNVGYGFGRTYEAAGSMINYSTFAKWVMIIAMLMGRLGLLSVFVLVLPRFWRW